MSGGDFVLPKIGVFVLCPGGFCPGGFCPGGILSWTRVVRLIGCFIDILID